MRNAYGVPDIGIPAEILFNSNIPSTGKILFGFIRNLAQGPKGCWASNEYLGMLLGISSRAVRKLLSILENEEYIHIHGHRGQTERNIYINTEYPTIYRSLVEETHKKILAPLPKNRQNETEQKFHSNGTKVPFDRNKSSIEYVREYESNKILCWKSLNEKYGKEKVQFVRWFLSEQKSNWPNIIKEKITPNSKRVLDGLETLEQLQRIDKFDFETEIKPILELVPNDNFWSKNVLSIKNLRNRSSNNGEKKFVNLKVSMEKEHKGLLEQMKSTQQTPMDLVQEKKWPHKHVLKNIFQPLWNIMGSTKEEQMEATTKMIDLIQTIKTRQKRPSKKQANKQLADLQKKWELIPSPFKVAGDYVKWIQNQDWLDGRYPTILDVENKVFTQFLREYQKNIGYDIFTGKGV